MPAMFFEPRLLLPVFFAGACGVASDVVDTPAFPDGGLLARATPLGGEILEKLRGNYTVASDDEDFPSSSVWNSTAETVSFFATRNASYGILRAGCLEDGERLVLEGVWRFGVAPRTGLMRLFVQPDATARALCAGESPTESPRLAGEMGLNSVLPDQPITFTFERPPVETGGFVVVAHRGGCRTSDACGASENSLPVLRMAESLGADAVEIDVQLTRDGVPIVYHDATFTNRLTRGAYCHGAVSDFTLAHVRALCTLTFGEAVPTLAEALTTAIDDTRLEGIWLDVKTPETVAPVLGILREAEAYAASRGRNIHFVFGLWSDELIDAYVAASPPSGTRCLVELEPRELWNANCRIWAPRWTLGPMRERVERVQGIGGNVIFWTLDEPKIIDAILEEAQPNAVLTNRPGVVRHRFQTHGQAVMTP